MAAGGAALIGAVLSGRAAAIDPQPGTGIPAATVAFNNNDAAAAEQAWKTYTNTRYVVSVHYPAALFAMGEAPPDNAGRGFEAKDGARFSVYSSANALDQDPSALLAETLEEVSPDDLRDKTVAAAGFTVIFRRDGEVVQRHLSTSEQGTMLHWLEIGYPQSLETKYAPVAARMIASFAVASDADAPAPEQVAPGPSNYGNAIALPVTRWVFNAPSKDYADLPALIAETDYTPENKIGQLTFVCQQADPSPAYFVLLVAHALPASKTQDVGLAISGAGSEGTLRLAMRDLYATQGGERPDINWDAAIVFAPVEIEDLGLFIQAKALVVTAAGRDWRLAGGDSLKRAGQEFVAACERSGATR